MMHQELQLVPHLTVAQNVFIGIEEKRLGHSAPERSRRLETR
jgi:ABC-type sugar transport system ATPase subunit